MSYTGGAITLTSGSKNFSLATGVLLTQAKQGDIIEVVGGRLATIDTILTNTTGTLLLNWPSPTVTAEANYAIHHVGPDWSENVSINERVVELIDGINTGATESAAGSLRLATLVEAKAGTAADLAISPLNVRETATEKLTANRTYYVRADGSDANKGLADTSGGAFLTIARAMEETKRIVRNGFTLTVQSQLTVSNEAVNLPRQLGSGVSIFRGDPVTPTNRLISILSGDSDAIGSGSENWLIDGGEWTIDGFELRTAGTVFANCIHAKGNAVLTVQNVNYGACSGYHNYAIMYAQIFLGSGLVISGDALGHKYADVMGHMHGPFTQTVTLTGTPNFSDCFATVWGGGTLEEAAVTYSGAATGKRFLATLGGILINWSSHNLNYYPGDAPGEISYGGQYEGEIGHIWTPWTPAFDPFSGAITTKSSTGQYSKNGPTVIGNGTLLVTNNGSGAGGIDFELPFIPNGPGAVVAHNDTTLKSVTGFFEDGVKDVYLDYADGSYPIANGQTIHFSFMFRTDD